MTATLSGSVVDGMAAADYHAHPALSSTAARRLLENPARFRWQQDHPQPRKREFDIGHAAHRLILGAGAEIVAIDADSYRTKAAQQARDEAYDAGMTPLLPHERAQVDAMVASVRSHPLAGPLLAPGTGVAERALFWTDPATGVQCRAMLDWSPNNRVSIVDVKTGRSADPRKLPKAMAEHGYPIQDRWYMRGARALGLADETTAFVFVFVEKEPPHGVTVTDLDAEALAWGEERCALACQKYRDCSDVDIWPGYPTGLITTRLPAWARYDQDLEEVPSW